MGTTTQIRKTVTSVLELDEDQLTAFVKKHCGINTSNLDVRFDISSDGYLRGVTVIGTHMEESEDTIYGASAAA